MTPQEFEHIAQMLRPRLISVGHDFFGHSTEAEDVAQEVFMRLWVMREQLDTQYGLDGLAIRMAKNICVSEWRKRQVRKTNRPDNATRQEAEQYSMLEDSDNLRMLAEALACLSTTERKLFRMRQELEMDLPQMAATTGIKPRSISAMLSAARRKVLEHIMKQSKQTRDNKEEGKHERH